MLVLSRKRNESIVINDDITIVVVGILKKKVRLGIEAPKQVPVHRREIFDRIHGIQSDSRQNDFCQIPGTSQQIGKNPLQKRVQSLRKKREKGLPQ